MKILRRINGVTLKERKRIEDVRRKLGTNSIGDKLREIRLSDCIGMSMYSEWMRKIG